MVQSLAIAIPTISMGASSTASSTDSASNTSDSVDTSTYADIPLTALSKNTRRQLSYLLNAKKILRSEEGYERDWRGLALLSQQKSYCDENQLSGDDPMGKVLQYWCSNNPKTATFANLGRFLGVIDRWDVCDDIYENLAEDAKQYNTQQQQQQRKAIGGAEVTDASGLTGTEMKDFGLGSDPNILTKDDVLRAQKGLPPQMYDAFVLFAEADINYATELIEKLEENPEYNFKLCSKDRDLLAGVSFAHVALTQLIEERCKHLIVILTEEFIKSPENKFLVNYTQALQIEHKTRKIIPLLYEASVVIPRTLKIYTHLKYNPKTGGLYHFWDKLAASIRNVSISTDVTMTTATAPPAIYTKDNYSTPLRSQPAVDPLKAQLAQLPAPPTDIPSISINGHAFVADDDYAPKTQERNKFKKHGSSLRSNNNNNNNNNTSSKERKQQQQLMTTSAVLRNAHSTSQLNTGYHARSQASSLSDLSTTSAYSESNATGTVGKQKKKKWPSKLFRKVFSRSSTKLQETA